MILHEYWPWLAVSLTGLAGVIMTIIGVHTIARHPWTASIALTGSVIVAFTLPLTLMAAVSATTPPAINMGQSDCLKVIDPTDGTARA